MGGLCAAETKKKPKPSLDISNTNSKIYKYLYNFSNFINKENLTISKRDTIKNNNDYFNNNGNTFDMYKRTSINNKVQFNENTNINDINNTKNNKNNASQYINRVPSNYSKELLLYFYNNILLNFI